MKFYHLKIPWYAIYLFEIGFCFLGDRQICGNGVVEGNEECDCGHDDIAVCNRTDSCCTTNCTLQPNKKCS